MPETSNSNERKYWIVSENLMLITGRMKLKTNFRWSVLMRFHSLLRRLESVSVNWNNDELEPNSGSGFPASLGTASVGVFFFFSRTLAALPLSDTSSVSSLQKPVSGNELIILAPYLVYRVLMAHYWSCPETVKRNIDTNDFFTCYDPVTSVLAYWFFPCKIAYDTLSSAWNWGYLKTNLKILKRVIWPI